MIPIKFVRAALRFVALAALAGGCSHSEGDAEVSSGRGSASLFDVPANQRAHLEIIKVKHQVVVRPVRAPARIAFDDLKTSEVTPLVSGKVAKVLVREGDHVKVGQPLLAIASPESSDTSANLARDTSELRSKQTILARDEDLYAHKAISLEELQQARLEVESAQVHGPQRSDPRRADGGTSGGNALLLSPIEGTVVARKVSVGDPVQAEHHDLLHDHRPDRNLGRSASSTRRICGRWRSTTRLRSGRRYSTRRCRKGRSTSAPRSTPTR